MRAAQPCRANEGEREAQEEKRAPAKCDEILIGPENPAPDPRDPRRRSGQCVRARSRGFGKRKAEQDKEVRAGERASRASKERGSERARAASAGSAASGREKELLEKIGELTVERDFLARGLARPR